MGQLASLFSRRGRAGGVCSLHRAAALQVFATAVPDTVLVDGSLASAVAAKLGIAISDVALARVPGAHLPRLCGPT